MVVGGSKEMKKNERQDCDLFWIKILEHVLGLRRFWVILGI